jgi:hypothetical protein
MKTNIPPGTSRRRFLAAAGVSAAAALFVPNTLTAEGAGSREPGEPALTEPAPTLRLDRADTAVVIIDPQNDVLTEKGLARPLLQESLKEINTVENIDTSSKPQRLTDSKCSSLRIISSL